MSKQIKTLILLGLIGLIVLFGVFLIRKTTYFKDCEETTEKYLQSVRLDNTVEIIREDGKVYICQK